MDYNEFRFEKIKELVKEGQDAATKYDTLHELIYSQDFGFAELEYIAMGFENPDWEIGEIKSHPLVGCVD